MEKHQSIEVFSIIKDSLVFNEVNIGDIGAINVFGIKIGDWIVIFCKFGVDNTFCIPCDSAELKDAAEAERFIPRDVGGLGEFGNSSIRHFKNIYI